MKQGVQKQHYFSQPTSETKKGRPARYKAFEKIQNYICLNCCPKAECETEKVGGCDCFKDTELIGQAKLGLNLFETVIDIMREQEEENNNGISLEKIRKLREEL